MHDKTMEPSRSDTFYIILITIIFTLNLVPSTLICAESVCIATNGCSHTLPQNTFAFQSDIAILPTKTLEVKKALESAFFNHTIEPSGSFIFNFDFLGAYTSGNQKIIRCCKIINYKRVVNSNIMIAAA